MVNKDPVGPGGSEIMSSFTSLFITYLTGLVLLLTYLWVLKYIRDLVISYVNDPMLRNIILITIFIILSILWLSSWYVSIKKIRDLLISSRSF